MWRQKYLLRRPSQISEGLFSSAPLYRHTIVQPCNKNFDFCSILPNQNTALPPWLQSSDLIGWKMTSTLIFPPGERKQMSRIQIQRHLINIQQMSWQTHNHTSCRIFHFTEFVQNSLSFNIGIIYFDLRPHEGCQRPKTPLKGQKWHEGVNLWKEVFNESCLATSKTP